MRTTITLDPDTAALVQKDMQRRGVTFKEAVNSAIRAGLAPSQEPGSAFRTRGVAMGTPTVDLDRAVQIAGALEDDELVRRMRVGK